MRVISTVEIRCFGAAPALRHATSRERSRHAICVSQGRALVRSRRDEAELKCRSRSFSPFLLYWDDEASVWSGHCDDIPAAADAPTLDELLAKISAMALDLLPDNHPDVDPASLFLQITALREAEPAVPEMAPQFDKPLRDLLRAAACMLSGKAKAATKSGIARSPSAIFPCRSAFQPPHRQWHSASGGLPKAF